jgi:hypothetical protein
MKCVESRKSLDRKIDTVEAKIALRGIRTALMYLRRIAMKKLLFSAIPLLAIAIAPAIAKTGHRTATFTSNTPSDSGRCTVEVVVPGSARVKIEGASATLQKEGGRDPEWRRFECTSPMPEKPVAFRVGNLGGRGKQELVHGPRHHGGDAVVYVSDPKHGEDTYTFDVMWGAETSQH